MDKALEFSVPLWVWFAFTLVVVAMLAIDLLLHRDHHVITLREAGIWSAVWIGAGLAFGGILWAWQGGDVGAAYLSGYLIEKALSVDNVFVFALIFSAFAVPQRYQHRVLFWGVVGALLFRLAFIFVGAELLEAVSWTAYILGVFLIATGGRMAFRHDLAPDPDRNSLVRLLRRVVPVSADFHGGRFLTRVGGHRAATLMLVALVAVEGTDLIFALDSVAAILAITTSTFIVWTANALAVLGLRALYFCLAGLLVRFVLLHYGLAFLLAFAGVKLILSETPVGKVPVWISLPVIVLTITVSIAASLAVTRGTAPPSWDSDDGPRGPAPVAS